MPHFYMEYVFSKVAIPSQPCYNKVTLLRGGNRMIADKQGNEAFPMEFLGTETLIVRPGEAAKAKVIAALTELDAEGNTVVITDSYLFISSGNPDYKDEILDVLCSLKAKRIIYTSYVGKGEKAVREPVIAALQAQGCAVEYRPAKIHDRYWFCLETNKAIAMNSYSGIGKRTSSIISLDEQDKINLKTDFIEQGVIEND